MNMPFISSCEAKNSYFMSVKRKLVFGCSPLEGGGSIVVDLFIFFVAPDICVGISVCLDLVL